MVLSIYQTAKLVLHITSSLLLFNFPFSFLTLDVTTYFAANIYFPFFTNWFGCLTFFIVVLSCLLTLFRLFDKDYILYQLLTTFSILRLPVQPSFTQYTFNLSPINDYHHVFKPNEHPSGIIHIRSSRRSPTT